MNTQTALYFRALRILTDGRRHSRQTVRWAQVYTQVRQRRSARELQRAGFTLREISLGAAGGSR